MTTHKPLTEVWFTTQLADYDCNMYGNKKEVFQVFPILSVKSAVQLLKDKLSRSSLMNEDVNEVNDLIDEAFPVFEEKTTKSVDCCLCGVVTCEGSVCDLNPDLEEIKEKE